MGLIIFLVLLFLVFWYLISIEFEEVAAMKGFAETKYRWLTFFFGIVGILLVIALPDRKRPADQSIPEQPCDDQLPKL